MSATFINQLSSRAPNCGLTRSRRQTCCRHTAITASGRLLTTAAALVGRLLAQCSLEGTFGASRQLPPQLHWPRSSSRKRGPRWLVTPVAAYGMDSQADNRRRFLLGYVQDVQPAVMEQFADAAPAQVVDAMRQTVTAMLGTLPPQFFKVTISAVGENLAQLMYSVLMTGYMFRNAQYRMELRQSLAALPAGELAPVNKGVYTALDRLRASSQTASTSSGADTEGEDPAYAPGTQKTRVSGEVLRWHHETGAEAIPAVQYMESLEQEIRMLRQQIAMRAQNGNGGNDLLDYLKSLEPENITELTVCAGEDVLEAMNSFIQRLLGTSDEAELAQQSSDSDAVELSRLLYWLMIVGYSLRSLEVRYDMESSLDLPSWGSFLELPPGDAYQ